MGNISQRESNSIRRQNNRRDSEKPNRHHGLVQGGSNEGMEKHFSPNGGECSTRISSDGGRSLDHHTKSILALPHGQVEILASSKHFVCAAREAIMDAPLRKISECFGKDSSRTSDYTKENTPRSANRDGCNGKLISAQTPPVLEAVCSMYTKHSKQPSSIQDSKACHEPLSKCDQGEERAKASMEIEGDRGGAIPDML